MLPTLGRKIMIFTRIKIKNLYSFHDCEIDLTFKRKVKNSTVLYEYLNARKRFNYKRVCIISGANASGKTSFGKVMCGIQNLIFRGLLTEFLTDAVADKQKDAEIEVEFVTTDDLILHRVYFSFSYKSPDIKEFKYSFTKVGENDSAETARRKLYKKELEDSDSRILAKKYLESWNYLLSNTIPENRLSRKNNMLDSKLLSAVLKALDSSIKSVSDSYSRKETEKDGKKVIEDEKNGYQVTFNNGDIVLIDLQGGATPAKRFSRGTYDAIKVADFIGIIMASSNTTFFLDEQLAHSHSDVEINLLNIMVERLSQNSQLFFTTHNCDVLDLNFPVHSYCFIKKKGEDACFVQPENSFKKNDRSLLNALRNDIFRVSPDLTELNKLLCPE